jgi:hypothetical protein
MTPASAVLPIAALAAAVALALGVACGRTELEPPFTDGSTAGTGGANGAGGQGGLGIPGAAGIGGGSEIAPIECGSQQCTPVTQACCVPSSSGTPHCIAPGASCTGSSFSCIDATACPANQICCFTTSTSASASLCSDVSACPSSTGFVLCTSVLDCPGGEQHCCLLGNGSGVCSPDPCS